MSDNENIQLDYLKEQNIKQNQRSIYRLKIFEKIFNEKYSAVSLFFFIFF